MGEPDQDGWLTGQVAALHGYLFELSEPDGLDQADEISALIPEIVGSRTSTATAVLTLETADRLAPFDSAALVGETPHLLERAGWPLASGWPRAAGSPATGRGRPAEPPGSNIPSTGGRPQAGTDSITASWSDPATHEQPAPRTVGTPNSDTPFNNRQLPPGPSSCPQHHARDHRQAATPPVTSPTMSTP